MTPRPEVGIHGWRLWGRRMATGLKVAVALAAIVSISSSFYLLWMLVFEPHEAEEWTTGLRPVLYYGEVDPSARIYPEEAYAGIMGVAHNSGGTLDATLEALIYGADVIEVDVVAIEGVLYAAHSPPLPVVGDRWFRGPRLDRIWTASYSADAISLDLKESSPQYLQLVGDFLERRAWYRTVVVSSREPAALAAIRERAPEAILLLSVPDRPFLDRALANPTTIETIDGVTIRESVADEEVMAMLKERELLVFAWTVNNLARVNELMQLGVDAITTDNLAVLSLLGGQDRGEESLEPLATPATREPARQRPRREGDE